MCVRVQCVWVRGGLCLYVSIHVIISPLNPANFVCAHVCVFIGCLDSLLFSLLICAAAACEAWANDDESNKVSRAAATFPLSCCPTVSEEQNEGKLCDTLKAGISNRPLWFIAAYCIADLNFCGCKTLQVSYCCWRNNENHAVQGGAEHWSWHLPALGGGKWQGWGLKRGLGHSSICSVCPGTTIPVFYRPIDLASSA